MWGAVRDYVGCCTRLYGVLYAAHLVYAIPLGAALECEAGKWSISSSLVPIATGHATHQVADESRLCIPLEQDCFILHYRG